MTQKQRGQYFTSNPILLEEIRKLVVHTTGTILEPSAGKGHIIEFLRNHGEHRPWVAVEIDTTLDPPNGIPYVYCDFLQYTPTQTFSTIVGNPPYVKASPINLYLHFLHKCLSLLEERGEMIMVVPTDMLYLTSGTQLRENMFSQGSITHIFRPNKENLFKNATQDVMVFRYEKGLFNVPILYNNNSCTPIFNRGILYTATYTQYIECASFFDIKVGMISGCDKVFRHPEGNINCLTRGGRECPVIFIDEYPSHHVVIDTHLAAHKGQLLARKISKITEQNWFKWGAIRNRAFITSGQEDDCIYMEMLTRSSTVAFIRKRMFFDGNLLCLSPKDKHINLEKWCAYFNSPCFVDYFKQSGRFKIGQRLLSGFPLPVDIE